MSASIVWFRQDLRLADNPALNAAIRRGLPIVPVYIWAPDEEGAWPPGGATRWWLHHSLTALEADLRQLGSRLILRHGSSRSCLESLMAETGADQIFWNRRYEPHIIERDQAIKQALPCQSLNGSLLFEAGSVLNKAGKPFQVFTPFYKTCLQHEPPAEPLEVPGKLSSPASWPDSQPIEKLHLLPTLPWADDFPAHWQPGEAGAQAHLSRFLDDDVIDYKQARDFPALSSTSRLSPHLHFGEISPRQIWSIAHNQAAADPAPGLVSGVGDYLRQVIWREFAHQLMFHFPHTPTTPLRPEYARFPWLDDPSSLRAWQQGQTGYPIVDAGMRELWHTGWMHNRVRMIVGSFLVKHLLLPWQAGAEWFWDTLVDADLANNTMGWQWIGGCGADAAPYFRIFNPIIQGEKFDADGAYTRRWVPELAKMPEKFLYKPWEATPMELLDAGVTLGKTYPWPIVDHKAGRERALDALASLKDSPHA